MLGSAGFAFIVIIARHGKPEMVLTERVRGRDRPDRVVTWLPNRGGKTLSYWSNSARRSITV